MPLSKCCPAATKDEKKRDLCRLTAAVVLGAVVGVIAGLLGVLLGYDRSDIQHDSQLLEISKRLIQDGFSDETIKDIAKTANAHKIKEYLSTIVSIPHVAGTDGDHHLARFIHDQWMTHGMDDVKLVPYEVLLSYPDEDRPNKISIHDLVGYTIYESKLPLLPPNENWTLFTSHPQPYFAYSPDGVVTVHGCSGCMKYEKQFLEGCVNAIQYGKGDLTQFQENTPSYGQGEPLFVNYGTEDDYSYLNRHGIQIRNRIVIAKLGINPCTKKVSLAELHGAVGLLVYADPADFAPEGTDETAVYNYTWWLPNSSSGFSTTRASFGDPLTPGYPSLENVFRSPIQPSKGEFPKILAHPITASDAQEILKRMGGEEVPKEWKGALDVHYRIGSGFAKEEMANMRIYGFLVHLKTAKVYNVIATITGRDEPDRYVLLGSHRDAWVKGAVDPGSGTAVMMELTRTLSEIRKKGWRPRRSIVFCSWGAEEFGMIGSTEWVEEHLMKLQERAVAYINVDNCVSGDDGFSSTMSPSLKDAAFKVARMIADPINSSESLFDSWHRNMKEYGSLDKNGAIKNPILAANSDFAPFLYPAGIPVMDITWNELQGHPGQPYPAYHTAFETLYYVETFMDPNYVRHVTSVQFTGAMLHYLADSTLLPFDFKALVEYELENFEFLAQFDVQLAGVNISLTPLKRAFQALQHASKTWDSYLENADKDNPYALRSLNDHMMLMHKAFFSRMDVNDTQPWFYRYGTDTSLFNILSPPTGVSGADKKSTIKRNLSNLLIMVQQLTGMLGRNPYGL